MTKSIHCAQHWAKSHSANYSSLTRNEHISQSASIRCSLWTNSNTLQPNPTPSENKLKQVIPRREGGVQKQRDAGKKKEPVDTFNETTKTGEDKKERQRKRLRTIHPIRNAKLKKPSSLLWTSTPKCVKWKEACDWLLSDLVRSDGVHGWEKETERDAYATCHNKWTHEAWKTPAGINTLLSHAKDQ